MEYRTTAETTLMMSYQLGSKSVLGNLFGAVFWGVLGVCMASGFFFGFAEKGLDLGNVAPALWLFGVIAM